MTPGQKNALLILLIAGLTIAAGFATWWSFVVIAFITAFYLARLSARSSSRNSRVVFSPSVFIAASGPALGWCLAALARDIFEGGRISRKLATLLHVRFAFAVYVVLALLVLIPSFLAAVSGAKTAVALRSN